MNLKFLSLGFTLFLGSSGWLLYLVTSLFPELDLGPVSMTSALAFLGGLLFGLGLMRGKRIRIVEVQRAVPE